MILVKFVNYAINYAKPSEAFEVFTGKQSGSSIEYTPTTEFAMSGGYDRVFMLSRWDRWDHFNPA